MRVTEAHHQIAEKAFKDGKNTPDVQKILHGKGLTKSQANSCCRTARKHLGIYKQRSKQAIENAERAKREADEQANKKTEVSDS
jgi:DNA-binding ferritin-like protein